MHVAVEAELTEGMIDETSPARPAAAPLTLETLESMALAASPSLQAASAYVNAARARALQAGLRPNPEAGIDFQQLGSSGQAEQYGVAFSQEIVRPRKLQLDRSIELHESARLRQELEAERRRVSTDVRIAYVKALRAQQQLAFTRQLIEISERGVQAASQLLLAKEVSRADLLQQEIELESASLLYQNALNSRLAVWREIGSIVGQPTMEPQELVGDLEQSSRGLIFEESLTQLQAQSPEIGSALAAIDRARCQLQRQLIETRPNINVGGLINWRDNGTGGDANGALVVSLPIPLWNQNQGAIAEARHQLTAAQRELEKVELGLAQRLAPVFERYSNAAEQVERYRNRILPRSAETLQMSRQSYELGEVDIVNLLTVQRTYANTQLSYLNALESLRLAEVEIDGLLLSGSLTRR
jgi:cobalt-zinc-cadmium efflux system outer membrane protein